MSLMFKKTATKGQGAKIWEQINYEPFNYPLAV